MLHVLIKDISGYMHNIYGEMLLALIVCHCIEMLTLIFSVLSLLKKRVSGPREPAERWSLFPGDISSDKYSGFKQWASL